MCVTTRQGSTGYDVRLGGYPARKCPRVTHNDNSPFSPARPEVSADLQQLFDDGLDFEAEVTDALLVANPTARFIDERRLGWDDATAATVAEMQRGTAMIVNGRLPAVDGRVGAPDVLVREGDGYVPVDIKHHGTFGKQKKAVLVYSTLGAATHRQADPAGSGDGTHRSDDTLQLAHYTRMLQGLGFHSGGDLVGGIIGTSDFTTVTGARYGITWYDLAAEHETTYSASAPNHRRRRSPLDRYDHEFAFRVRVAQAAQAGRELVRPIGTSECWTCAWQDYCAEVAGPDDPSFAFSSGRLEAREWLFLASRGGDTIEGLSALDPVALAPEFAQHAVNKQKPQDRLAGVVARARMIRDDIDLEPLGATWPVVPAADVEIDLDVEWGTDQLVYQWGVRVRKGQDDATASYLPGLVSYEILDAAAEAALADAAADRLEDLVAGAGAGTVAIFHWSHVEVSRARKFPRLQALLEEHGFDLYAWMKENYRVRGSFSIKDVAPLFDFQWGMEDAGGFASMRVIEAARMGNEDARQWCREYNEADVAAQAAIRDGLRARATAAAQQ